MIDTKNVNAILVLLPHLSRTTCSVSLYSVYSFYISTHFSDPQMHRSSNLYNSHLLSRNLDINVIPTRILKASTNTSPLHTHHHIPSGSHTVIEPNTRVTIARYSQLPLELSHVVFMGSLHARLVTDSVLRDAVALE